MTLTFSSISRPMTAQNTSVRQHLMPDRHFLLPLRLSDRPSGRHTWKTRKNAKIEEEKDIKWKGTFINVKPFFMRFTDDVDTFFDFFSAHFFFFLFGFFPCGTMGAKKKGPKTAILSIVSVFPWLAPSIFQCLGLCRRLDRRCATYRGVPEGGGERPAFTGGSFFS